MGHEQPAFDLFRDAVQVLIVPCRQRITEQAGLLALTIPPDAESVAIGNVPAFKRPQTLPNQRVLRLEKNIVEEDRRPRIG